MLLLVLLVLFAVGASAAVLLVHRNASGRRLEEELHATGTLEPMVARSQLASRSWEDSPRAA